MRAPPEPPTRELFRFSERSSKLRTCHSVARTYASAFNGQRRVKQTFVSAGGMNSGAQGSREERRFPVSAAFQRKSSDEEFEPALDAPRVRVLLADDDEDMLRLIVSALRKDGCEIQIARDGTELIEMLGAQLDTGDADGRIDVIVSDICMPGASGLEALAALRKRGLATPVILMTAFGSPDAHSEAHKLNAIAVLNKPFDMDDLRIVIGSFGAALDA
jgi:CheY-like chemotaxis protein